MDFSTLPIIVPCTILFVVGIALYNIIFMFKNKPGEDLTHEQRKAMRSQTLGIVILIFTCFILSLVENVAKNFSPGTELGLALVLGKGIWLLAGLVFLFIGFSAIKNRVIVITGRGSSVFPTGRFAVFEGVLLIIIILIITWVVFSGY